VPPPPGWVLPANLPLLGGFCAGSACSLGGAWSSPGTLGGSCCSTCHHSISACHYPAPLGAPPPAWVPACCRQPPATWVEVGGACLHHWVPQPACYHLGLPFLSIYQILYHLPYLDAWRLRWRSCSACYGITRVRFTIVPPACSSAFCRPGSGPGWPAAGWILVHNLPLFTACLPAYRHHAWLHACHH